MTIAQFVFVTVLAVIVILAANKKPPDDQREITKPATTIEAERK